MKTAVLGQKSVDRDALFCYANHTFGGVKDNRKNSSPQTGTRETRLEQPLPNEGLSLPPCYLGSARYFGPVGYPPGHRTLNNEKATPKNRGGLLLCGDLGMRWGMIETAVGQQS